MNGNRGAKGSIKDRLISMLYTMRYKKYKLKEENYSTFNKEKQVKYLYNLKEFNEKEDINLLSKQDQKRLDEVSYNVNFKINNSKGIDLELLSIESKSKEHDEKVDIKKEIKKTKEEVVILKEVDTFIKKSLENIEDINKELQIIKKESKEKNQDTNKLEQRYIDLRKKVDKLKLQYDTIKYKYDLSEFSIIESIKLIDSISNYKSIARLNEMEMLLKVCKKEINEINSITIITEENKKIGLNIENTKKEQKQIKIKFNKSKEKMNELKTIEDEISKELKEQQEIIDEMYKKASYFEKEVNKEIEYVGHTKILSSLIKIAGGVLTLPFTGKEIFGIALGSTMINKGLKQMNEGLEKREKLVINFKYEDISKQISEVKDKVEYINLILSDSLNEIKKLKNNFNNFFKEYDKVLPEYSLMLEKIENLENKLIVQQEKINNMDKKLDKEKEMNKQKLKKINE